MMLSIFAILAFIHLVNSETIVNFFEWSHYDVAAECSAFLKTNGYDAVQVSPVNEAPILPNRPWYERYQTISYRLISRSGDEDAFKFMVNTCNRAGIKVYVDVVFNHMTSNLEPETHGTWCSVPNTHGSVYPHVPYGPENFHRYCDINWNDRWTIRNCELNGLHDLDQSQEHVRAMIVEFLNHLVDIGVAGFRVDAAKLMEPDDLKAIYGRVNDLNTTWFDKGSRPYFYHEVFSDLGDVVPMEEYTHLGGVYDFKYSFELTRAFQNLNGLKWFIDFGTNWKLLPIENSLVFVDNHDTQRSGIFGINPLHHGQSRRYKMANGFMLAWPFERAVVMSSYEFNHKDQGPPSYPVPIMSDLTCSGGWKCEHRWRQIYNMAKFASVVRGTKVDKFWSKSDYQIAFCRGDKGFIVINAENNIDLQEDIQTCLPPGVYCDVVSGKKENDACTGISVMVCQDGKATFSIPHTAEDGFLAIHIESKL